MDGKEIVKMRMDGRTFQEIADYYGTTKQAVHTKFRSYLKILDGERGRTVAGKRFNINRIPYKGLYEHFREKETETISSFALKVSGSEAATNFIQKMKTFLNGTHNALFKIDQIKRMCEIVGKPFEEVFEEREV